MLAAVREDRMPGGRNSGAVYNLYKVKYRKHKKNNNNSKVNNAAAAAAAATALGVRLVMDSKSSSKSPVAEHHQVTRIAHGDILKTALTNPSEVLHLRRRLESTVSSSRDLNFPYEPTIKTLILCDEFEDIATLKVSSCPLKSIIFQH